MIGISNKGDDWKRLSVNEQTMENPNNTLPLGAAAFCRLRTWSETFTKYEFGWLYGA